jgi:hypothetical protein
MGKQTSARRWAGLPVVVHSESELTTARDTWFARKAIALSSPVFTPWPLARRPG